MSFTWNGDDELIVQYPDDLPTPRLELTNTTFGPGGRCRVVYEAVSRKSIRPLRWTRTGELRRVAEESLERGVLVTLESDGRLQYTYTYYDTHEPDSSSHALQALGLQGGGETWAGIIYGLVSLRAPDILDDLEFDAESDGLAIRSTKRSSLVTLAHLVAAAKGDRTILMAAVERALQDGQVE